MSDHPFAPPETSEPPGPRSRTLVIGSVGVALTLTAFVFGVATGAPSRNFDVHWADGPRVIISVLGVLLAGCAVSMRPKDWLSWMPLAAAGLLCYGVGTQPPDEIKWMVLKEIRSWYGAVPNSWDSIQFLGGVIGVISLIAAVFTVLPAKWMLIAIFGLLAFFTSGIIASVLSPPATPFLVEEYWRRYSRYHSQFLYINNAYHFYSPEPGPPSELWICLKYAPKDGQKEEVDEGPDTDWVRLPDRMRDTMDPLRLSYFRRIALVDQVAQIQVGYNPIFTEEVQKANERRMRDLARIPKGPNMADNAQYLPPQDPVIRQTLPSFTNHFAKRFGKPGRTVASVRVYRVLHEVLSIERSRSMPQTDVDTNNPGAFSWKDDKKQPKLLRMNPYSPMLYNPYYQGEYDLQGHLLDPTDPELYWLVPIIDRKIKLENDKPIPPKEFDRYFIDYVSIHAGSKRPKE